MINSFVLLIHQTQTPSAVSQRAPFGFVSTTRTQVSNRDWGHAGGRSDLPGRAGELPVRRGISANTRSEPWMSPGRALQEGTRPRVCRDLGAGRSISLGNPLDLGLGWGRQQRSWRDNRSCFMQHMHEVKKFNLIHEKVEISLRHRVLFFF